MFIPKNSLTPPFFIIVSVTSQESERPCFYVLAVSIFRISMIFLFGGRGDSGSATLEWYVCHLI